MYELTSTSENSHSLLETVRNENVFSLFEAHGIRYHVEFKEETDPALLISRLEKTFTVEKIAPNLEDVFIRLVEGKNR